MYCENSPATLEMKDGVVWVRLDQPGKKVNIISPASIQWFEDRVQEWMFELPRAVVIESAKKDHFVAGADLEAIRHADRNELRPALRRGHLLLERLGRLPFPVIALIHGACLGGGLELALACSHRIATDHSKTKLGLPEVQLGLIPGLGGTQRLPRLVGVPAALDMVLTGRQIGAKKAKRISLVDAVCHPADQEQAVDRLLSEGISRKDKRNLTARAGDALARSRLGDKMVWEKARSNVQAKTGGHYPAPFKAIEVMKAGLEIDLDQALMLEAEAFEELLYSDIAQNLIGIFFAKQKVDHNFLDGEGRTVGRVGVLGAGLMGAGIAQVLSYKGQTVLLKDRDNAALARGLAYIQGHFNRLVRRRRWQKRDLEVAMGRIQPTTRNEGFGGVDFVVEAVFEDRDLKRAVLQEIEEVAPDHFIFASNTSTIPIGEIAAQAQHPENVVGMHFFSPVPKMPLLEVICHSGTSESTVNTTVRLGRTMGKTVIVVKDGPGFFTSRVLAPYLNEAAWCLVEGATVEEVDSALTDWGWPVGGLSLMDEVGLDVARHAGATMVKAFGDRMVPPEVMRNLMKEGRKGRKSGRGFYLYDGDEKKPDESLYNLMGWSPKPLSAEEIADRCWLAMLNEVARTLEEGIIEEPAAVEIGVIFGLGFPPFRGGILRQANRKGLPWVVDRLQEFTNRLGSRFTPAPLLMTMAEEGQTFQVED